MKRFNIVCTAGQDAGKTLCIINANTELRALRLWNAASGGFWAVSKETKKAFYMPCKIQPTARVMEAKAEVKN